MKKIFALIFLCIPVYAVCQTEKPISKGNSIISGGGTIEYSRYKSGIYDGDTRNITFNPGFGYFVIDNFALGINTTFGYSKHSVKSYTYGIGPYAKYYFPNGLFLKAETFVSHSRSLATVSTFKVTNLSVTPGIGYSIFLNSKISLEPSINYRFINSKSTENEKTTFNNVFFELKLNLFL